MSDTERRRPNAASNGAGSPQPSTLEGVSPLDLKPLDPVPVADPAEVQRAVERAREAQRRWRATPVDDRILALTRAAKDLLRRRDEVIGLARREVGKLEIDGLFTEALGPLDAVSGWAKVVRGATARRAVRLNPLSFPGKKAHVELVPRGVVGVIAPWNFPAAGLYRSTLPALMTGNGLVVKPSEYSPRTSAWYLERLAAHLPDGLLGVVQGGGDVGEALLSSGIDACVFTGSVATGRRVGVRCAELGIPSSLEMGGKDPAIVLADCELERTVAGVTQWALNNAGQACGAIELAIVDRRIADAFVDALESAWRKLRVGPGRFAEVDVSPLANERQLALVEAHVDDAKARGATVRVGGARTGTGLWHAPTLLDHCTPAMRVVREETFGPVLPIVRVDGAAEAIELANSLEFGLTASIWTQDGDRGARLADRLDYGTVSINNHAITGAMPELPWTGTRQTGFGVANSRYALSTFVRPKTLLLDGNPAPELYWLPNDESLWEVGDLLADAQIGKILGAWKIPLLFRERIATVRRFFRG